MSATAPDAAAYSGPERRAVPRDRRYNHRLYVELCRSADTLLMLAVLGGLFLAFNAPTTPQAFEDFLRVRLSLRNVLLVAAFAFVWRHLFLLFGLYEVRDTRSFGGEVPSLVSACTLGAVVGLVFPSHSRSGALGFTEVLLFWPAVTAATLGARYAFRKLAERAEARRPRRLLIVGSGPLALGFYRDLVDDGATNGELLGFVDTNPAIRFPEVRERLIGGLDDLERILMHTVVDEVLIALPVKSCYAEIQQVIARCESAGVQSRYSADIFPAGLARPWIVSSNPHAAVSMQVVRDDYRLAVKRAVDIAGATAGLVALAPVLALIAVLVKCTSPGPVLFSQERYGWRKRRFRMLKFRTMVADAEALQSALETRNEAAGPVFKIQKDPRLTRVGRFLRHSSLDELPQLWNVLRGDMSLVGPRPLPTRDVHRFSDPWLMRRFSVLPGCTGLWQVSGRSDLGFDEWVRLDLHYIDTWSLGLDMRILLRTLPAVLRGTGAR